MISTGLLNNPGLSLLSLKVLQIVNLHTLTSCLQVRFILFMCGGERPKNSLQTIGVFPVIYVKKYVQHRLSKWSMADRYGFWISVFIVLHVSIGVQLKRFNMVMLQRKEEDMFTPALLNKYRSKNRLHQQSIFMN